MKKLVMDDVKKMDMCQLWNNCVFVKDGWIWYRDFERELPLLDLIREIDKNLKTDVCYIDDDALLDEMLCENTQYGTEDIEGVLSILYCSLVALARVRSYLEIYEKGESEEGQDVNQKSR